MYADDSTMYRPRSTLRKLNDTLNIELKAVADWVAKNNLVLNICKRIQTGKKYSNKNGKKHSNN